MVGGWSGGRRPALPLGSFFPNVAVEALPALGGMAILCPPIMFCFHDKVFGNEVMPSRLSRGRQNNIDESNEEILEMRMCRVLRRGSVPVPTCTGMLVIEGRVRARRWKVAILITESLRTKLEQTRPKQFRPRLGEQTRPTFRNWSKLGLH